MTLLFFVQVLNVSAFLLLVAGQTMKDEGESLLSFQITLR